MEDREKRLKRLRFRATHRGIRELDILVGAFADAHLDDLSAAELDEFEALMQAPDQEFYAILRREMPIPEPLDRPVMRKMIDFVQSRHACTD